MIPYTLAVYDKQFRFKGWVGNPTTLAPVTRHNVTSTATFQIDADHLRAVDLLTPGARVMVYRHDEFQMSGPVTLVGGDGTSMDATLTFTVADDFRILRNILGWPVPENALSNQNQEYCTISGPAETVVKQAVVRNAVRLGIPLRAAPDLGRGARISVSFRFHPLEERLFPAVDQAGIGVTIRQDGAGFLLDVYEPRTFSLELSDQGGTLTGGSYSIAAPTVTRVVVGGQGEGVARQFRSFPDASRESEWGDVIEVLQDARDSSEGDVFAERAAEVLGEGAPLSGLTLELSETKHFRVGGDGIRRGDRVSAVFGGQRFADVVREVKCSWDADGDNAQPIMGERSDDPNVQIAKQLRALRRGNNDRKAR